MAVVESIINEEDFFVSTLAKELTSRISAFSGSLSAGSFAMAKRAENETPPSQKISSQANSLNARIIRTSSSSSSPKANVTAPCSFLDEDFFPLTLRNMTPRSSDRRLMACAVAI